MKRLEHALQRRLGTSIELMRWDRMFELSMTNIENLERQVDEADFAIAVLTLDDRRQRAQRGRWQGVARDNVVFEMGLFMGRLGRARCLLLQEDGVGLVLPSDLEGIDTARFGRSDDEARVPRLAPAVHKLAARLESGGPRADRGRPLQERNRNAVRAFCRSIEGDWWSIRGWTRASIGLLQISGNADDGTLAVHGDAYRTDGSAIAHWDSDACAANAVTGRIYFHFTGYRPQSGRRSFQRLEGLTTYTFDTRREPCLNGDGLFVDQTVEGTKPLRRRSLILQRASPAETVVIRDGDADALRRAVARRLARR